MKLHVRILHAKIDPNETDALAESIARYGTQDPADGLRVATVELEAPLKVSWHDQELELEELEKEIVAGVVRPTDLVNDGSGWSTIDAFPPLSDACARAPRHLISPEERAELGWPILRLILIALGIAAVAYFAVRDAQAQRELRAARHAAVPVQH